MYGCQKSVHYNAASKGYIGVSEISTLLPYIIMLLPKGRSVRNQYITAIHYNAASKGYIGVSEISTLLPYITMLLPKGRSVRNQYITMLLPKGI